MADHTASAGFGLANASKSDIVAAFLKPLSSKVNLQDSFFHHRPQESRENLPLYEPRAPSYHSRRSSIDSDHGSESHAMVDIERAPEQIPGNDQEWKPHRQEWLVMITMSVSSLLVALDSTILVPVLPTLAVELHGSATDAFWAGTSYLLAHAVLQPFIAALSDIFGRRELLLPSLVFFTIGSLLCALANDFTLLLIGRVVQGIGGAGIIALSQIVFADIVPLRQRPKYFAIVLAAWAIGSVLGPFIGGIFVERVNWRWCFWINLPICAVAIPMAFFFLKFWTEKSSLKSKLARVDWVGGFLFIASMTSWLIGLSWGGVQFAWTSWHTYVPLAVGAAGTLLSLGWERYFAREAFLYKSVFCNLSAIAAYTCALFQGLVLYMALYYGSFYFSSVLLQGPLQTGISLFPATCAILPGSIIVSQLITRFGVFRWAIWSGWTIATVGCGMLILLKQNTPTAVWATALTVFGLGMGMALSSINFAIQAIVDPKDAGRAAAMYAFMRSIGMTIGVATGGSIFQNLMSSKLTELKLPLEIAHNSEAFVELLKKMAVDNPVRVGALEAYVHGFQGVFMVMCGMSGIALLVGFFIKHHSMEAVLGSRFTLKK